MQPNAIIDWIELPIPATGLERLMVRIKEFVTGESSESEPEFELWKARRVLYAFAHPQSEEILYVGKAWSASVGERYRAKDKRKVHDAMWKTHRLQPTEARVFVGFVEPVRQSRVTRSLVEEIEQLLIYQLSPCGNQMCRSSYRCRDRLVVRCTGDWPPRRQTFVDEVGFE